MKNTWTNEILRVTLGFLFILACIEAGQLLIYAFSPVTRFQRFCLQLIALIPLCIVFEAIREGTLTKKTLG